MRNLLRFLYRSRNTILFLALMVVAFIWAAEGNRHHQAKAVGAASTVFGRVQSVRDAITSIATMRADNERLLEDNARLRDRHVSSFAIVDDRIQRIQDTLRELRFVHRPAAIVNSTHHKQRNIIMLDKGSLAGVEPDMGVVGPQGVIGVIDRVGPHFSVAISMLDVDLSTSVQFKRTGHFGLLRWDTNDPRTASVHDIGKHARILVGDTVETRGSDGIFPKGIPVGLVTEVRDDPGSNYHGITIELSEDLTRSRPVFIIGDLMMLEQDTLQAPYSKE